MAHIITDFMLSFKNIVCILLIVVTFIIGYTTGSFLKPIPYFIIEYRDGTTSAGSIGPMPLKQCLAIIEQNVLDVRDHKLHFPNDRVEPLHLWCFP